MAADCTKQCPHCGAFILAAAIKCRYCRNLVDEAPIPEPEPLHVQAPPAKSDGSWPWWGGVPVAAIGYWWFRHRQTTGGAPVVAPTVKSVFLALLVSVSPASLGSLEQVTVTVYNDGSQVAYAVSGEVAQYINGHMGTTRTCTVGVVPAHSSRTCVVAFMKPAAGRAEYRASVGDSTGHSASGSGLGHLSVSTTYTPNQTADPSATNEANGAAGANDAADSEYYDCYEEQGASPDDVGKFNPADYEDLHFEWEYGDYAWSWDPLVPNEYRDYYSQRERTRNGYNYAVFATDAYEAPIISQVVCLIEEAAATEGYTPWETVEFTLAFVHSLDYITDAIGSGYDEYPKFPIETLLDQRGDCEDSAILFASLVKGLGYDVVLVLLPQHMAAAVRVDGDSFGTYYTYNGARYYYVETTPNGGGIGDAPPKMQGQTASILPLIPKAILANLDWGAPTVDDNLFHFVVDVQNLGSAPVDDVTLMMGFDAGNNRIWSKTTYSEGLSLEPDELLTVDFWVEPPPRNKNTRVMVWAWGSNAATVEAHGNYYVS